jgi:Right handed beta helix region
MSRSISIVVSLIFLSFISFFSQAVVAETVFYVDPDYTGSTQDGSAVSPWFSLDSAAWGVINNSLNSQNVTVFFSARKAASDTDQVYGAPSEIDLNKRTNTSSFMLTFDGHSMYNTNPASPNWQSYSGTSKCNVRDFYAQNGTHTKRSNITIDGFRISMTVGGKAVAICGDNWTLKNSDIFHTSTATDGPLVLIVPTSDSAHEGSSWYCPASTNITIANNTIHDSYGELIYVGGGGCSSADSTGTSLCMGFPAHNGVTIQNNTLYNGGVYGAQGDGIDVKGGLYNLQLINNTIYNLNDPRALGIRAIVHQGARDGDPDQNNLIANNYIHDVWVGDAAIALVNSWGTPRGIEVRNNIIANATKAGIKIYTGSNLSLYNNTIYKSGSYGVLVQAATVVVKNNLLLSNNSGGTQTSLGGTITSSNNAYSNTWNGACASCVPGLTLSDVVNAAGGDFHPTVASRVIDVGIALPSFSTDYDGTTRPQGSGWDIGAYEFSAPTLNPPTNLRIAN